MQVKKIFNSFRPDAVFGVGGYSSYPVLRYAQKQHIPNFLHEANSFAGKANIMLAKNATTVMVVTKGMEKFFPTSKIIQTGNPVRSEINGLNVSMENAFEYFGLKQGLPTVLIMGGSLGAKSINQAMSARLSRLIDNGIQVIWQTGKGNLNLVDPALRNNKMACITEFISKMDYAYTAADLVVSRAGAIAIAEICATGKASILVPYPLAAEDHQTANAMTLAKEGAAILIKDAHVTKQLTDTILSLINDKEKIKSIGLAATKLFTADADTCIAEEIINCVKES